MTQGFVLAAAWLQLVLLVLLLCYFLFRSGPR